MEVRSKVYMYHTTVKWTEQCCVGTVLGDVGLSGDRVPSKGRTFSFRSSKGAIVCHTRGQAARFLLGGAGLRCSADASF
jgi:hypothetical protein